MALLDPSAIRRLASRIGLKPSKQRGQNFVTDANTVRRIVALADLTADDHVLEVGPGLGSLTAGLLETGAQVTAIEIEQSLATLLPETMASLQPENAERLQVIAQDALQVRELPGQPTAVVANLPYNVAVPVIVHLLEVFPSWQRGIVMVQLEVADRLVAAPGSKIYGVPSAKVAWFADAKRVGTVPPTVFWPVPNVDSGLVALERHEPLGDEDLRRRTFAVIDAAFAQRRKMLRSALSGLCGSSAAATEVLEAAGVEPTVRGEMLGVEQFAAIARALDEAGMR